MSHRYRFAAPLLVLLTAFGMSNHRAEAGLIVSVEAPGVQQTSVAGAITETFDSGAPSGVLGTYTNMLVLSSALFNGAVGGAFGTDYGAVTDGFAALELNSPQKYFGMWWAAGDSTNAIALFDEDTLLGSFLLTDFNDDLGQGYFGNPNNSLNPGQPYAYLNFTATGSSNITGIFFVNGDQSFLESDNHSVFDQPIDPPGTVLVPEPSSLLAITVSLGTVALRRKRRNH